MRLSLLLILLLAPEISLCQEPSIKELVDQLGASRFEQRREAEETLTKKARGDRSTTRPLLEKRFTTEKNPEIRHRLKRILRMVSPLPPLKEVFFTKANLDQKIWEVLEKDRRHASFRFRDEGVEIDSLRDVKEGLGFVHRLQPAPLLEGEKAPRFGPAPKRVPQRLVIEADIKVLKDNHIRPGLAAAILNVEDDRACAGLLIKSDGIFAYRHKAVHRMDTTDDWHHYRLVVEGPTQRLYVDKMDVPVLEIARPKRAGRQWVTFGDLTAGGGAQAHYRNVRFARYPVEK